MVFRKKFAFIFMLISFMQGCIVDEGSGDAGSEESTPASLTITADETTNAVFSSVLTAVAQNVVVPSYERFSQQVNQGSSSIDAYCDVLGSGAEPSALVAAQTDWRFSMVLWQRTQAFIFGPASDNSNTLSQRIYSWPNSVSTCTLDRNVVLAAGDTEFDIQAAPQQARGLDALEYLLFNGNLGHTCAEQIVETQSWNSLTELERKQHRCEYASRVNADITNQANQILSEWQNSYLDLFTNSGSTEGLFDNSVDALSLVTDALFFLDKDLKDIKISAPLGFENNSTETCAESTCPELVESLYSNHSLENIKANLLSFKAILIGGLGEQSSIVREWLGFDYILATKNFPEIATELLANTESAIALIDGLSVSLGESLIRIRDENKYESCINAATNPSIETMDTDLQICALQGYVKRISDELKGDFLTVISLSLPSRVEGDND